MDDFGNFKSLDLFENPIQTHEGNLNIMEYDFGDTDSTQKEGENFDILGPDMHSPKIASLAEATIHNSQDYYSKYQNG
jgi:hypothetical protein